MRSTRNLSQIQAKIQQRKTRIEQFEREGRFNEDIEDDLPAKELLPQHVDYLAKKFSTRLKIRMANFLGDRYFLGLIKKEKLIIERMVGEEYLSALEKGAILTCNHFSVCDHYIVFHCIRKFLPRTYLYKVIKEGNYTNFPGLFGFLMRYCNTLPLSRNRRTMMNFTSAVNTLLKRGETVLVYPEQSMWQGYRKPRPFQIGAFKMAYRANVPVVPTLITMQDDESKTDENGEKLQRHTLHILPPIYPDLTLGEKTGAEKMKEEAYRLCKACYEEVYRTPLVFSTEEK